MNFGFLLPATIASLKSLLGAAALLCIGVASVASAQSYVLTALDFLGGTASPGGGSQAFGINDHGQVVG